MGAHWKLAQPGDPLLRLANPARNPEEQEQKMVIQWAWANEHRWPELRHLFHIPNGGNRGKAEAGIFKAMGVRSGVSDLFLPVPKGGWMKQFNGLWIEMKAVSLRQDPKDPRRQQVKLGDVSAEQIDWLQSMIHFGFAASIAWDRTQAQQDLERYLTGRWSQRPIHEYLGARIA